MHSKPELRELLERGSKVFSFNIAEVQYEVYHYPGDGFQYMVKSLKLSDSQETNRTYVSTQDMHDLMAQMQQGLQKINHMLRMIEISGSEDVNA